MGFTDGITNWVKNKATGMAAGKVIDMMAKEADMSKNDAAALKNIAKDVIEGKRIDPNALDGIKDPRLASVTGNENIVGAIHKGLQNRDQVLQIIRENYSKGVPEIGKNLRDFFEPTAEEEKKIPLYEALYNAISERVELEDGKVRREIHRLGAKYNDLFNTYYIEGDKLREIQAYADGLPDGLRKKYANYVIQLESNPGKRAPPIYESNIRKSYTPPIPAAPWDEGDLADPQKVADAWYEYSDEQRIAIDAKIQEFEAIKNKRDAAVAAREKQWINDIHVFKRGFRGERRENMAGGEDTIVYSKEDRMAIRDKIRTYAKGLPDEHRVFVLRYLRDGKVFDRDNEDDDDVDDDPEAPNPVDLLKLGAAAAAAASKDGKAETDPVELLSFVRQAADEGEAPGTDPEVLLAAVRGLSLDPTFEHAEDLLAFLRQTDGDDGTSAQAAAAAAAAASAAAAAAAKAGKKGGFHKNLLGDMFGDLVSGAFADVVVTEVSPQQLALGVILMACVYMHGWSLGRDQASDLCAQGPESCGAVTIVWTMFVSTLKSWVLILFLLIILLTVEIAVIGVLRRSIHETAMDVAVDLATAAATAVAKRKVGLRMMSVRVLFAWLFDPRMLLSIGASFASAAAFAAVYSTLLGLKDNVTADDFRACAQNSYAFQIVAFVAFVVAQFWLKTWWISKT